MVLKILIYLCLGKVTYVEENSLLVLSYKGVRTILFDFV